MKADAYGHGIDLLVPSVVKAGIPCIGIASNEEARVAREKGFTGRLMRVRAATPDEVEQALPYKMEELVGSLVSAQASPTSPSATTPISRCTSRSTPPA